MLEMAPDTQGAAYQLGFAGDTFNTAWYIRKLLPESWKVSYFTAVGTDQISENFREFANQAGIDTKFVQQSPGKTMGLYLIQLTDAERSFIYWRSDSAAKRLADDTMLLDRAMMASDVIYFSGITVAILDKSARSRLYSAINAAKENGATIAFDPNLRPALWRSRTDMTEAVSLFAVLADIALPSYEDESTHFGDESPMVTINRYQGWGTETVIVKNGSREIIAKSGGGNPVVYLPPNVSNPVDTTAAGDSFNASFLADFLSGALIEVSLKNASELASKVISGAGALVNI